MKNSIKILVKFPCRERPQKFKSCIANMIELADDLDNIHFLITIDDDDKSMKWALTAKLPQNIQVVSGISKNKTDAINRDMQLAPPWDIVVQTSDDMKWIRQGWDTQIRNDFEKWFPDLDGVMHYPDGYMNEKIVTLTIMGRKYYDRDGYLYHPSYTTLFSDDELTQKAKMRGKYRYVEKTLFLHQNPFHTGEEQDDLFKRTQDKSLATKDYLNLEERRKNNFGMTPEEIVA